MSSPTRPYSMLLPGEAHWRESNIMKIPNTNLAEQLGGDKIGARLWRLPPHSANTWHRHVEQDELYFVLEGMGRMRVGEETLTVPKHGAVLVRPEYVRQIFNDTDNETLWLIVAAPRNEAVSDLTLIYPEDPRQLPPELAGRTWPPGQPSGR